MLTNRLYPYATCLIFILFVSVSGQTHGTADFQIRTPREIAIAADSRTVDNEGKIISDKTCKIIRVGRGVAIRAGFSGDRVSGLNVLDVLQKASNSKLTLSRQIVVIEETIKGPLENVLDRLRGMSDPSEYKHFIARPVDITIVGIEKGTPVFYNRRFVVNKDGTAIDSIATACPGKDCPDGTILGHSSQPKANEYVRQLRKEFPKFFRTSNLEIMARRFVELAMKDDRAVGGPIDSVRITLRRGIENTIKPECVESWK